MTSDRSMPLEWLRAARSAARQVFVEGTPWLVYELPPAPFDRRSAPSLVFEAEHTVRRVRMFPTDWRKLPDEELFALSWNL